MRSGALHKPGSGVAECGNLQAAWLPRSTNAECNAMALPGQPGVGTASPAAASGNDLLLRMHGPQISHSLQPVGSRYPTKPAGLTHMAPQPALLRRHRLLLAALLAMLGCILGCRSPRQEEAAAQGRQEDGPLHVRGMRGSLAARAEASSAPWLQDNRS